MCSVRIELGLQQLIDKIVGNKFHYQLVGVCYEACCDTLWHFS